MSRSVLVTGGAGYVGCVLVSELLERNYRVRVVDKLIFGSQGLDPVKDRIELVAGDIRNPESGWFEGIDSVIHLAGISNDPTAEFDPKANEEINTEGTLRVAEKAKESRVDLFLFASSCSIYYTLQPDDAFRDEGHPTSPQAPYSYSKRNAEKGLSKLADDNFSPVFLRNGTVFGPSPRSRYDLVVNTFTKDAFQHRHLIIHAGGRMWRPMLHIEDAADAYIACLEAPRHKIHNQIFNVLSDNYQVIKIAHEVRRALEVGKGIRLDLEIQQVGTVRSYRVAADKFRESVNIDICRPIGPAVSAMWDDLETGIDPDDPIYYNIRWFELLVDMQRRLGEMGGGPFV